MWWEFLLKYGRIKLGWGEERPREGKGKDGKEGGEKEDKDKE